MVMDGRRERRQEHRFTISASAVLFLEGVELGRFAVDNLSITGALFTGEVGAARGDRLGVLLAIDGRTDVELDARVVRVIRSHGCVKMAVELEHWSSATEDALREALLGAHSPSEIPPPPSGPIALPELFDLEDPDFLELVPPPH